MRSPLPGANLSTAAPHSPRFCRGFADAIDDRQRGNGSVLTVSPKPSSNGSRDVESVGVWRYPRMRAISRLHVRTIATRSRLLRRTAAQEKMNAGGTAWHQHGADTRFLSCPDADTRHRPQLIIHHALQWRPVPATVSAAGGHDVYFGVEKLDSGVCRSSSLGRLVGEAHKGSWRWQLRSTVSRSNRTKSHPSFPIIEILSLALKGGNAEGPSNFAIPGNSRLG